MIGMSGTFECWMSREGVSSRSGGWRTHGRVSSSHWRTPAPWQLISLWWYPGIAKMKEKWFFSGKSRGRPNLEKSGVDPPRLPHACMTDWEVRSVGECLSWLSLMDTNYNKTFIVYYGAVILGGDNQSMMHLGISLHIFTHTIWCGTLLEHMDLLIRFSWEGVLTSKSWLTSIHCKDRNTLFQFVKLNGNCESADKIVRLPDPHPITSQTRLKFFL